MEKDGLTRILLVEDESMIRMLISDLLKEDNYNVTTSDSGRDALNKFENEEYGLIICDKNMPGLSGIDVFNIIRQKKPEQRFILLTGEYNDIPEIPLDKYSRIGRKPIQYTKLSGLIREISTPITH
jgi:CheY-like chemotaxis protein